MIETDYPINNLVRIIAILLISLRRRRGGECVTRAGYTLTLNKGLSRHAMSIDQLDCCVRVYTQEIRNSISCEEALLERLSLVPNSLV